jgi:hypothetical protein
MILADLKPENALLERVLGIYEDNKPLLLAASYTAVGVCILSVLSALLSSRKGLPAYAAAIRKDIRIQKLFIHPIKSCRGSSVSEANFDEGGLQYDRTWLIIDAISKRFQTARELPRMVTIRPHMDLVNKVLDIHIPLNEQGKGTVTVRTPLDPSEAELDDMEIVSDITIWGENADGYAVSKEADDALSTFFGKPVRLVRKGPGLRNAGPDDPRGLKSAMHFQDFYPILIASSASIQHVRNVLVASVYPSMVSPSKSGLSANDPSLVKSYRVSDKVSLDRWTPEELESLPIERFRPNIVVESFNDDDGRNTRKALTPWEEDSWTHIEVFDGQSYIDSEHKTEYGRRLVGQGTPLDCVARCGRCMVPNVDPDDGVRDNFIPYTVMQRFRQVQPEYAKAGKPCFGVLASPSRASGTLRVGDIVRVTHVTDPAKRVMRKA